MKSGWSSFIAFVLVVAAHAGALGAAMWLPAPPPLEQPPTISGVLIQAPPAEVVQAPSAQVTPPEPEPMVQPKPKPKPKPKPQPKPKPKPKPLPPPPAPLPPSEKAITAPPPPVQEQAPPPPQAPSTPMADNNDTLGAPVEPPRIDARHRNNPAPAYPSLSRRRGEEGTVVLELLIMPDGSVAEISVKESSGFPRLDQTALKAVKRWRYTPAKRGGKAIEYRYLQPIAFTLN